MRVAIVGAALALAGCAAPPLAPVPRGEVPVETRAPGAAAGAPGTVLTPGAALPPAAPAPGPGDAAAGGARWVAADWSALAGFDAERAAELWPALLAGCARPAPVWRTLCARALLEPPGSNDAARRWLQQHLEPWRIETADGRTQGLATGYFEPTLEAARRAGGRFQVPLHGVPAELATRRPFYTREQLDTLPAAQAALRGRELLWIENPIDALAAQVQGSARARVTEPDGRVRLVRLAFAAHNGQPFGSLGRWLIDQGELTAEAASWPAIKAWAERNPQRVRALLWANPRVVFFREEPLPDPTLGPRGAQGVPLTPGRSVAVDPQVLPHGTPLWLDTTEPLSATPLRRLVMAQDSGGAITGAVRIDLFFGWTPEAEAQAGRMKQPLRLWALWPRGAPLPGP